MRRFCSTLLSVFVIGFVLAGCDSGGNVPSDLGDNTSVGFVETSATVVEGEDETYSLELVANDPGFKDIPLALTVESQSTVTLGEDLRGLSGDTTIVFPQSTTDGGTLALPLDIVDEPVDSTGFLEDSETLSLSLSADTSGISVGNNSTFTLTVEEDDDPLTIAESRERPSDGRTVTDAMVTRVASDGVYLQDGTGGAFVFDSDFAGQVSKGDSVRIDGSVGYFDGVFQVSNVSSGALTQVFSSGNALPAPQPVSLFEVMSNGEEYESELIEVAGLVIDDDGDDTFQGGIPAGLYDVSTNDTTSTLVITSGSDLVGEDIPDRANFRGVLSQFNGEGGGGDEPDEGYQLVGLETGDLQAFENLLTVRFDDGTLSPMSAYSVASDNDWNASSPPVDNAPVAQANGFGGNEPANDWLITPALNFNNFEDETLAFVNAKGFNDNNRRGLQVKVSTDYSGSGDPTSATWTDVSDRVNFADEDDKEGSFTPFIDSGRIDLSDSAFQDSDVYVAFQYRSSGTDSGEAAQWQVDNITVNAVPAN